MSQVKMPKPMAYIVMAGGRIYEVYDDEDTAQKVASCLDGYTATVIPLISTTQAEAYTNARVKQALEKAANKVADPVNIEATIENFGWVSHGNYVRAHLILRDAVEAIRALIPKEQA